MASIDGTANPPRHPALVRVTHWITVVAFAALLLSGVEIVISHPRFYWGETGNVLTPALFQLPIPSSRALVQTGYDYVLPDQNGWSRSLHFQAAWIVVLTGLLYLIGTAASGHFGRSLLPERAAFSWRALASTVRDHLRFSRPRESEAWSYNLLQRLSYLAVILVLFPLIVWTGLAMSPAFVAAVPAAATLLGGVQSARTIHFVVSLSLVLFLLVHLVMIWRAGFISRTRTMITGHVGVRTATAHAPDRSRRTWVRTGAAAAAGLGGVGLVAKAAGHLGLIPPDGGGIWGLGETLTYGSHRLIARRSLAREFPRSAISPRPLANEMAPPSEQFRAMEARGFVDWRLAIDGLVARPGAFTLEQLRGFPARSQVTQLACEEGWSYIAEWTGVPLAKVLEAVGTKPNARYVVYRSVQSDWWDSIDMADALHPQTLLTYGMNGEQLPVGHGGPLRMRIPRQLGYKNIKFITSLTVTDSLRGFGKGLGSSSAEAGYAWYVGI